LVVVIVKWYIRKGSEEVFKETWKGMKPTIDTGLFREFYSKPIDRHDGESEKYQTLDVESNNYNTYINVGIWHKIEDFDVAIGSMIPKRKESVDPTKESIELFKFEFKLRERIVMDVEEIRAGKLPTPKPTF
jgi:hypothetical protein